MSKQPLIIGAGLSGLLAAHAWPRATVHEAAEAPKENHKAVLRFRGEQVSALTGIPFKKVMVRKGIWYAGNFHQPTIQFANLYSKKVLGRLINDRSIWNIEPAERYIAPEDFYFKLIEAVGDRIKWNDKISFVDMIGMQMISTIPLPVVVAEVWNKDHMHDGDMMRSVITPLEFNYSSIKVQRYRIPDCDLYQTIYFPDPGHNVYRASITGDLLIAESSHIGYDNTDLLKEVFGISTMHEISETKQKYGKIAPIDEAGRRAIIRKLSELDIYSLGRFATWRNILLDDLVHDIQKVKHLIDSDTYSRRLLKDL